MKMKWRKTLAFVSCVLVIALIGATVLPDYAQAYAAKQTLKKRELTELRTENSKTYYDPDKKKYIMEEYLEPIHYKKKWRMGGNRQYGSFSKSKRNLRR